MLPKKFSVKNSRVEKIRSDRKEEEKTDFLRKRRKNKRIQRQKTTPPSKPPTTTTTYLQIVNAQIQYDLDGPVQSGIPDLDLCLTRLIVHLGGGLSSRRLVAGCRRRRRRGAAVVRVHGCEVLIFAENVLLQVHEAPDEGTVEVSGAASDVQLHGALIRGQSVRVEVVGHDHVGQR